MSKTLWHTIKIAVPEEMVNITKKDKVVVKKSLTKNNNISKSNKEPSIKLISSDINKPKIISDGKEWNVDELKIKMKKSKDLGKKNEGKEFKKKSENKILNSYVKKVNDKINENKNKEKEFTPITSFSDFKNQLKVAVKKDKAHINTVKSTFKQEPKPEQKPKSDIDEVIDNWNKPDISLILSLYDEQTYNNIQNIIKRENKKNHHIFTPDLLAFTKKYNDIIVLAYSKDKNYKLGMDILYKGLYRIINNVIDFNDIKMKPGSPTDVFKDRQDYNLGLKRLSKPLATKIYAIK
jgi:hypothetical protein